ncbi:XrtA-associated tyrosine autokinase [Aromatoleum evansii]|uniref:non-specific protein-tyrosine kinase n=1 Tax=Aromatoleum evansii TaxID=59406 RepID=A0ABZ1AJX8_AROEV|nr:XrtA-associated tyrosine autokinase [Aromatoleum evansii]
MSLIEKAVERLDQLKRAEQGLAGGDASAAAGPVQEPDAVAQPASAAVTREAVAASRRDAGGSHADGVGPAHAVVLDLARLSRMGMVTPDLPQSAIAEEYRVVKRPLIHNAQGRGAAPVESGNLIMVTSALPGEGKSFTAMNLAMSIAMELDNTVLLVDADFARPSILQRLGLPPRKGLMDVLVGDVPDLSDVMLRTNVEKLSILPAGMTHQRSTELIASDAMTRMLEEMATRYAERIIVFDSPPLLSTTEARVLASHMGQVVVVVESGRTTHGAVKQALGTIENCPVKLLVLNKATEGARGGLYGYGYGYGYGYRYGRSHGSDAHPDAAA